MEINEFLSDSILPDILYSLLIGLGAIVIVLTIIFIIRQSKIGEKERKTLHRFVIISGLVFIIASVSLPILVPKKKSVSPEDLIHKIEAYTGETVISEISKEGLEDFLYNDKALFVSTKKMVEYRVKEESQDQNGSQNETEEKNIIKEQNDKTEVRKETYHYMLINNGGYVEFYFEEYDNYFQRKFFD